MENDRLAYLMSHLDTGIATAAELDELETLLSEDYSSRERFLDHAQIEGLLVGIGEGQKKNADLISVPFSDQSQPRRRRILLPALTGIAAALIFGLVTWDRPAPSQPEPLAVSLPETVAPRLSADERYEKSRRSDLGGASLAHPETADKTIPVSGPGTIEFNRDIRPILSDNCVFCHGPDAADRKADLRFDTEEGALAAIVRGDSNASELIDRVYHTDPDTIMPPPESERTLTAEEKETLRRWIDEGAAWQKHWAFEPPVSRETPPVSDTNWPENEIDPFILARLDSAGLAPSPDAEKETLLRRVTINLTGLPPTVAEADAFVADPSPDAYSKVVDRLLHTDAHAEHMAWHWLEAARYADTDGYQNDGHRDMWRWRDWVVEAYKSNMPFDQFTIEQLAGDLLPDPTRDQLIATGFNRNGRYNSESGLVIEEFLLENAVDRVDTTMTVWTGLTAACARCHDHKYDPITHEDYYSLISFFDNITESGRAIKIGNSEPWIKAPTREHEAKLAEIDYRLSEEKKKLAGDEALVAKRQSKWERTSPHLDERIVSRGISTHLPKPVVADGSGAIKTGKFVVGAVPNNRYSLALTVTPDQVDTGAIFSTEAPGTGRQGVAATFEQGKLRFYTISRWIAGAGILETTRRFAPGESFHLAITNDGTQRTGKGLRIYIDGRLTEVVELQNTNSNRNNEEAEKPLFIGGSAHLPTWKGAVADFRVYSKRVLTPTEIAILADPTPLPAILATPSEQRSPIEAAKLRHYYQTHAHGAGHVRLARIRAIEEERLAYLDTIPTTMVMEEAAQPKDTHLRIRGEYHNHGPIVTSRTLEALPPMADDLPRNRLGFAKWLVAEENPLVARVAVNQLWQMLFGTGLVKTTGDFGTQGELPSHPALLDTLAVEYRESGWDTKALLKKIVTSRTYQQSSTITPEALEVDPANRLLSRAPRLKLRGNALRDQALVAGGLLVPAIGGPPVKPYQPANLWKEASNFTYKQGKGDDLYRRSLYTYWKRTLSPPSMAVLDTADREWCSVKPKSTNTPLQALALMNETAFFEAARKLGERVLQLPTDDLEARIRYAFRSVLTRDPDPEELSILVRSYQEYENEFAAEPDDATALQTTGDSATDGTLDPIELAAATAVANVIFNLEEASVRE